MFKRIFLFVAVVFSTSCFFTGKGLAITLITDKEALASVFPMADEITSESKTLTQTKENDIKKILGGSMVMHTKGKNAQDIMNNKEFVFYYGVKNNKKMGVAIILEEPGKWGPITYIVEMDLDGKVEKVVVMKYTETRGRPIARKSFLKQFEGKTLKDDFELNKDIMPIAGATISCESTAFVVKKAVVLYEELVVSKSK